MARVLEEQVGLSESQQRQVRKMLAETVGFTEQLVAAVIHSKAVADTVSLTETQTRQVGKAIQETLGLTETRIVQLARRIEETVNLQEILDVLFIPPIPAIAPAGFISASRPDGFSAREEPFGFEAAGRVLGFVSPERPA
jgi:hypothetical protein